ncbi:MAG TPA: 30S ribosome-binding factor RbfA [Chthoniobacteraceae bacterium]|jgi:ribosome-binding factor A|nr:rbfA [Chthoniobacter sp.]HEV7869067.1 30S ribosome-binding factor RbfA [Chthoniobacteraceae bacterium]
MKYRLARVNEVLKRELGDLVRREITFPAQLVTIQQVDVTPDLKHAHVFVSIIGPQADQHASMAKLHDARIQLQNELSKRVVLKFTPQLHFKLDQAAERGDRILNILSDLEIPEEADPEGAEPDDTAPHDR